MQLAKDALTIFMQSLPVGCRFTIISFGSHYSAMEDADGETSIAYTDATKERAIESI